MVRVGWGAFAAVVGFFAFPASLWAQVSSSAAHEVAYPTSLVSPDNASATSLNPSALAALPAWSLTYSHVAAARATSWRDRYDAAWFATPLGELVTFGTGLEFNRAGDGSAADYNGFLMSAALHSSPRWSLGLGWHMRSPRAPASNIHSADLALTLRLSPTLAISLIGRDLAPHDRALGTRTVRETAALAIALRPVGDDRLLLELAGRSAANGDLALRLAAQTLVPWVGRLGAAGELSELEGRSAWTVSAGLDVRWGMASLAPAVHFGEDAPEVGWSLLADLHGQPRPGLPLPRYVAKLKLRGLGPRALLRTLQFLERAVSDPQITGVVLLPEDTGAGLAISQELRLMVTALKQAGKPTYCYLSEASGSEYYLCAAGRRTAIDPAGVVRLMGVGGESLYFGELLHKLGLRADFVRIGRYKSAPEQYTNDASSEPTREVRKSLLDGAYRRLVSDLAQDLGRDEARVRAAIDRGPFLAQEALADKLVATTLDAYDLERDVGALFGAGAHLQDPQPAARDPRFGPTGQVGVVVVDGTIIDGDSIDIPFFDVHMSGGRTVVDAIDKLAEDRRIRAIVLRIDSPGGAVMASDQIWRAVRRARAKKPVIASMGSLAASGGYYIAAAASEIWALPSTITGSIGIFYGKVDVAELAARIGVTVESDARGAHAGADSLFRPFTDEERAALADKLRIWYRQFLERVADGRKLPMERVDELGRGRVYSGDEAQALGLVDSLGGFNSALARARELVGLDREAELVVVPERPSNLLDYVLGSAFARVVGSAKAGPAPVPPALKALVQRIYPWTVLSGFEPMALYEGPLRLE